MRKPILLACTIIAAASLVGAVGAAPPNSGTLSVDRGKGVVTLDLRGNVLGRLANGTVRVTDQTPRDRFGEIVFGRDVTEEQLGPRTVLYRGQGLRFRMVGGGYRIVIRGSGIVLSVVGRGVVQLDGERKADETTTGVYSFSVADCSVEPTLCTPLPDERESFVLEPAVEGGDTRVRQ